MDSAKSYLSGQFYQFTFLPRAHGEDPALHTGAVVSQKRMDGWPSGDTQLPLVLPFGDEQEDYFLSQS